MITPRDLFAAIAMHGMLDVLKHVPDNETDEMHGALADQAFEIADAMIAKRGKVAPVISGDELGLVPRLVKLEQLARELGLEDLAQRQRAARG